jgi:hypothetical protein
MASHTILSLQLPMEGRPNFCSVHGRPVHAEEADIIYPVTLCTFISRDTSERSMAGKTILFYSGMRL